MDLLSVSVVGDTVSVVVRFDDCYTSRVRHLIVYTTAKVAKTETGYKVLSPKDFNRGFKQVFDWSFVGRTLNCLNSHFLKHNYEEANLQK